MTAFRRAAPLVRERFGDDSIALIAAAARVHCHERNRRRPADWRDRNGDDAGS
jgi:hypothetical protein